jgi:ABC-type glycerol-3-phosphate transport system substrate-binding protein
MRRTITFILIGILTVITALSGCSNSKKQETKKPDKNTIKFATFYSDKDQGALYKEIAKAFEKANDKIKVEVITDYSDDKAKESLSQKGDIDIIGLRRDQIIEFSKSGYLKDMSDFIDEKGLSSKLYKISLAYGKYNGKTYGIGDMPVTMEWFYNTDMFKKYNVPVPTNLSELMSASSKFKSRNITPIAVGAMDGWTLSALFGMITSQTAGVSKLTSNFGSDADAFRHACVR